MEEVSNFCPAIAVPMTVKIPEPITAPMPSAVSETGPSVFFRRRSGCSESDISLSIDLQQKSWFSEVRTVGSGDGVGCDKRVDSPGVLALQGLSHLVTVLSDRVGPMCLPLRLSARQLLHFLLLRSASVLARLECMFRLALLAYSAFRFFAIFFAESRCISHESCIDY